MKKIITLLLALVMCFACVSLTACSEEENIRDLDDIVKSGKITVATNAEFPPFESKEGTNYVGIDIEIAQAIADYLDVELVINNMDFDAVVTSVQKGQSDLALAALTISAKRKKAIKFSDAYFGAAQYLIVKNNNTEFDACQTKEDVDAILASSTGKKGVAQNATTGYYYLKGSEDFGFAGFSNIQTSGLENPSLCAMAVVNGQADYLVVDKEVAESVIASNNGVKAIEISLSSEEYGIGVNKSNSALLKIVNKVLEDLKVVEQDGTSKLDKIFARHIDD